MSDLAKKVAGTYIPDEAPKLPAALGWLTQECRTGRFSAAFENFCFSQPENLDRKLTLVEHLSGDCFQGRIPCRCYDHESAGTFTAEVRFSLNPANGALIRLE